MNLDLTELVASFPPSFEQDKAYSGRKLVHLELKLQTATIELLG